MLPSRELGIVILGNNMLGTYAATNTIAYHIIDRVLGIPETDSFDWVKWDDDLLQNLTLTKSTLQELYPTLPDPLLSHSLSLSAYRGSYVHHAYPELTISADCPDKAITTTPDKWTGVKLCASIAQPIQLPSPLMLNFFHITDTFWTLIASVGGVDTAWRVEFRLARQGTISHIGIEIDPAMASKGEKIWWEHMSL
ncbi:hypothetical protein FE257_007795 [Aspergillus nanangensis]|uniref:Uncharacterized protein n=1 Tax=Aspergillus nanangensis TaxID=2582783 RepID=A0AAD4CXG0_ASPNN|nr:hypothetical protein FE257_007795 [Aspergillus nanangensis]